MDGLSSSNRPIRAIVATVPQDRAAPRRSAIGEGLAQFRFFSVLLLIVALLLLALWSFGRQQVHQHLRAGVESQLQSALAPYGLGASVRRVNWDEGQNIRLEGVTIRLLEQAQHPTWLEIDQVVIDTPSQITDLILGGLDIRGIRISHMTAVFRRDTSGRWNVEPLMELLTQASASPQLDIPVTIRSTEVQVIDMVRRDDKGDVVDRSMLVGQLHLQIQPGSDALTTVINAQLSTVDVPQVKMAVEIDPPNQRWRAVVQAEKALITSAVVQWLPEPWRSKYGQVSGMHGRIDVAGTISGSLSQLEQPHFHLAGQFTDVELTDPQLPGPITRGRAQFALDNQGLRILDGEGRWAGGTVALAAHVAIFDPLMPWNAQGRLRNVTIDHRMYALLPESAKQLWDSMSPSGKAHIDFAFAQTQPGQTPQFNLVAEILDASFTYARFPFRLSQINGRVLWTNAQCVLDLRASERGQTVFLRGDYLNPGPKYTGYLDISVDGPIPIDEKLLAALDAHPETGRFARSLRMGGRMGVTGRMQRTQPNAPAIQWNFLIDLHQCFMRYERFDYALYNLNGPLIVSQQGASFQGVTAENAMAYFVLDGQWDLARGLYLDVQAQSLPLDEQLKKALPPRLRSAWHQLQPAGVLDAVQLELTWHPASPEFHMVLSAEAFKQPNNSTSALRLRPLWFPYDITHVSGRVRVCGSEIVVESLEGKHGRTWLVCQGQGGYDANGWHMRLTDLLVGSLQVDDDLIRAVPDSLGAAIRQLQLTGQMNLSGELMMMHHQASGVSELSDPRAPARPSELAALSEQNTDWSLQWTLAAQLAQVNMHVGLPLKDVSGEVRLTGHYDTRSMWCEGELDIDSLLIEDVQVTRLRGPLWIDGTRIAVGTLARTHGGSNPPTSLQGSLFGGTITIDAQTTSQPGRPYYVQAALNHADLKEFARQYAPRLDSLEGTAHVNLQLAGEFAGKGTARGQGSARLHDARIYELPVMLALLKVLRVSEPDRTAFDEGQIDFSLRGEDIVLNRIELIGNAISLVGNGKLDFSRSIDLNFYTVVGRNKLHIPILTELYRASSQQILWIQIAGTLDQPTTIANVLPGINESIKQLFGESEAQQLENPMRSSGLIPNLRLR